MHLHSGSVVHLQTSVPTQPVLPMQSAFDSHAPLQVRGTNAAEAGVKPGMEANTIPPNATKQLEINLFMSIPSEEFPLQNQKAQLAPRDDY
jgi:hypothetical protein